VLSFDFTTVTAIALFAAASFVAAGVISLFIAASVSEWRWLHVLIGILSIAAGVLAIGRPGITFVVLAAILAWFLLFRGIFNVVFSLFNRASDYWWLWLIAGILEVLIGFWAISYPGRALVLLVVWVGAGAIIRGITEIAFAFELKSLRERSLRTST
jgi:uncharacterized membrane protein HdeD (DUF308 family)